jgi:hypothetical protein
VQQEDVELTDDGEELLLLRELLSDGTSESASLSSLLVSSSDESRS